MNTYPTSNDAARLTHALWDAAPACDDFDERDCWRERNHKSKDKIKESEEDGDE